jgi:hypothetical protein
LQPFASITQFTHVTLATVQSDSQLAADSPQVVHFVLKVAQSFVGAVTLFLHEPALLVSSVLLSHVWFDAQLLSLRQPFMQMRLSQYWPAWQVRLPHVEVPPVPVPEPEEPEDPPEEPDEPPEDDDVVPVSLSSEQATRTPPARVTATSKLHKPFIEASTRRCLARTLMSGWPLFNAPGANPSDKSVQAVRRSSRQFDRSDGFKRRLQAYGITTISSTPNRAAIPSCAFLGME